jgi:hypothetical protein
MDSLECPTDGAWLSDRVVVSELLGGDHFLLRHRHCVKERLHRRLAEAPAPLMWPRQARASGKEKRTRRKEGTFRLSAALRYGHAGMETAFVRRNGGLAAFARVHNGSNNGRVSMSARMVGERLNVSKDTANRAIKELVTFGFLLRTRAARFASKRVAAEYLMTHVADDRTDPKAIPLRTYQNIGKTAHLKIVKGPWAAGKD